MKLPPASLKKASLTFIIALLPLTSFAINYSQPIIVNDAYIATNGNIIEGNYASTTTGKPAITISTSQPVTITNSNVQGPGDLIYGAGSNLTVTNTNGYGINPNVANVTKGKFVHIEQATNLIVENCYVEGTQFGVYVNRFIGNSSAGQTIKILYNQIRNIDGRPSDGNGGYATSGNFNAHAFQFNGIQSVPNLEIAWNEVINEPYDSQTSDIINIYSSSGTSTSHILIHDNYLQGAYPVVPGVDHYTGGGIITDGGSSNSAATATAFVDIFNNQVVSTSNYGLSIAAGHDNSIYNNRVISSGQLADGTLIGMYFANGINNYNNYSQPTTVFYNNYVSNNPAVGLVRVNKDGTLSRSDWYLPGQASSTGNNAHWLPNKVSSPTLTDEANEFQIWQNKLQANNITLGSN